MIELALSRYWWSTNPKVHMSDYLQHVVNCIEQFHRVRIKRQTGTCLHRALLAAARNMDFDWWFVAPRSSLSIYQLERASNNITFFSPIEAWSEIKNGNMLAPRGLVLEAPFHRIKGMDLEIALPAFIRGVYAKAESRIVTVTQ